MEDNNNRMLFRSTLYVWLILLLWPYSVIIVITYLLFLMKKIQDRTNMLRSLKEGTWVDFRYLDFGTRQMKQGIGLIVETVIDNETGEPISFEIDQFGKVRAENIIGRSST